MRARLLWSIFMALGGLSLLAGLGLWRLASFDLALHRALLLSPGPIAHAVVQLSALGGLIVMGPLAVMVALWRWWGGDRRGALWLAATITIGRLIVEGTKLLVRRPRPPLPDRLEHVASWSFPSSHSAGTMMTGLAIALLLERRAPALAVAITWTLLIGWTRIALGVHWPSDVLAGWGFGLLWVGLAARYGGPMRSG